MSPTSPRTARSTIVVVGAGMVAHRFCDRLAALDAALEFRVIVLGEEPREPYDRVHLTSYLGPAGADALSLGGAAWYAERGIDLRIGRRVTAIDTLARLVRTDDGDGVAYDALVLATGSAPLVPPVFRGRRRGLFVYRTIDDLDALRHHRREAHRAAVIGGGLLGLEAAKALHDLGLHTHVVELAPRLMPRQLDDAASRVLRRHVESLGIVVHVARSTARVLGDAAVCGLELDGGEVLDVDTIVVSAGIVPRDELARAAGLEVAERGGVVVDEALRTSDPRVYAIGEVASRRGTVYGLVGPGYEMADVLARRLTGDGGAEFHGADTSTKLKLLGVDVASFGDAFADAITDRSVVFVDLTRGVYKKIALSADATRVVGGMLVGEASRYPELTALVRSGAPVPAPVEALVLGAAPAPSELGDDALVCSCNDVSKRQIACAVREQGATTLAAIRSCTRAGSGCGGCAPLVADILALELRAGGAPQKPRLCEHFAHTRQELFHLVRVKEHRSFDAVLAAHGTGSGCEICKPTIASLLATLWNEHILDHDVVQDSNDRFLANLQRGGLYSVVPRIPGGEITPDRLIALGTIAKKYDLYTKITGGQRIDLFGATVSQLPEIWEDLVNAGFESGHAYGKAMRTVKSCVGSTWCRYGVQDSVGLAIRIEDRYKGIRAPHKLKSAVSGCARECAEAQSKDFGLIATENGWNVWVAGNGGMRPRHADLLASDVDEDTAIRLLDRFIGLYLRTADRLTRTSVWLEKLEGGIDYLRSVVVDDSLGIAAELEAQVQGLVDTYRCEWAEVVRDPRKRARFRHFADAGDDDSIEWVRERGQRRPRLWARDRGPADTRDETRERRGSGERRRLPVVSREWVRVAAVQDVPREGGIAVRHGSAQIAVFHFASRGEWYAVQNACPHRHDMVLARGLLGDELGTPKVACPLHKRTYSLSDGRPLSEAGVPLATFPVRVDGGGVFVELPPVAVLERALAPTSTRWSDEKNGDPCGTACGAGIRAVEEAAAT